MKIPFDRVVRNLELGRYRGKISAADYANTGIQPFDYRKFADQLGVHVKFLEDIGLLHIKEFSGWHLHAEPSVTELLKQRSIIEAEANRLHEDWLKWKRGLKP